MGNSPALPGDQRAAARSGPRSTSDCAAGVTTECEFAARKPRLAEFVRGILGFEAHADKLLTAMASVAWDVTYMESLTALGEDAVCRLLREVGVGKGPAAAFLDAWNTQRSASRHSPPTGPGSKNCSPSHVPAAVVPTDWTISLPAGLQETIAAGWDGNRMSDAFRLNEQSVQMIRRSAGSLLQSRGVAQRKIVEHHHAGLLACGELLTAIKGFHNQAVHMGREAHRAVVLMLLQRGAHRYARRGTQLASVAVAIMYALLRDCSDRVNRFLRDDAVVFLHRHGTVLNDDYHRAFCAIVIGSACGITSAPAVRNITDALSR